MRNQLDIIGLVRLRRAIASSPSLALPHKGGGDKITLDGEPFSVSRKSKTGIKLRNAKASTKRRQFFPGQPVRPERVYHQWRKYPSRELSVELVAGRRFVEVTRRIGALRQRPLQAVERANGP
jgi:hypothetical protein